MNNDVEIYKNIASKWGSAHQYSPAPLHRRRLLLNIIKKLDFQSCLDMGCAQPFLLESLSSEYKDKNFFGCDISDAVIKDNREKFPQIEFEEVDLSISCYPGDKKFDLVISSEVFEHIPEWQSALKNMARMSEKYVLITVPSGKIHKIDKKVGHFQHFKGVELKNLLEEMGFKVVILTKWGFPMHTMYKYLINSINSDKVYEEFAEGEYGFFKRLTAKTIYGLFYINDLFSFGKQLLLLAEKDDKESSR